MSAIFNGIKGDPRSFDLLDRLLGDQVYRLSYWRVATEEINYRRFFDINGLSAIRMEDPDVFRETHALLFRLIREGKRHRAEDRPRGRPVRSVFLSPAACRRSCFIQLRLDALAAGQARSSLNRSPRDSAASMTRSCSSRSLLQPLLHRLRKDSAQGGTAPGGVAGLRHHRI